jgi:ankyrin repeat protein
MLRKITIGSAVAVGLAMAAPLAAQTYSDGYKFLQAVEKQDVTKVNELLAEPGTTVVNSRDLSSGRSALHITVARRDKVWLSFLLGKGANPNIQDNNRITPLMLASQNGFVDGIELLISRGAEVDRSNETGETPLILAVHRRDAAMIRVLLAAGADPERTDNSGRSARDYAQLDRSSTVLAEFTRHDQNPTGRRAAAGTYGPG